MLSHWICRFVVRPALARFFVGAYMLLKERVEKEHGNVVFGLAKPLTDNVVFYGYSSASPSFLNRSPALAVRASPDRLQSVTPYFAVLRIARKHSRQLDMVLGLSCLCSAVKVLLQKRA